MRTWLAALLSLVLLFVLPKINTRRARQRFPLIGQVDRAINIIVVVSLAIYLLVFIRWLFFR
jgi:hypothetical protein